MATRVKFVRDRGCSDDEARSQHFRDFYLTAGTVVAVRKGTRGSCLALSIGTIIPGEDMMVAWLPHPKVEHLGGGHKLSVSPVQSMASGELTLQLISHLEPALQTFIHQHGHRMYDWVTDIPESALHSFAQAHAKGSTGMKVLARAGADVATPRQ